MVGSVPCGTIQEDETNEVVPCGTFEEVNVMKYNFSKILKYVDNNGYEIKKLNFDLLESDEVLEKKKGTILRRLIVDLKEKLDIVAALTTALDYSFGRNKKVALFIVIGVC